MAVYFYTQSPDKLLATFKKAIKDGHVITWSCDSDGDFTHTTEQWKNKAWLRPTARVGMLELNIVKPKDVNITSEVYAIYHGRFIEAMLRHCDTLFSKAEASALPAGTDQVR